MRTEANALTGARLARADGGTHVVQRGETLSEIAARTGTTWRTLARLNGLSDPDLILVGQRLALPGAGDRHVVRPGETLSGIAARQGTSVSALARLNGIADPDLIHPGQLLRMPGRAASRPDEVSQGAAGRAQAGAIGRAAPSGPIAPGEASLRAADLAESRAAGRRSQGQCYAWVKDALLAGGATSRRLVGVPAKEAGRELEREGFVNVLGRPGFDIRSPYDAPKGAVLVYADAPGATDRNRIYGHIEIRTERGFASDYFSTRPRTGDALRSDGPAGRVLIGVYVKPDAGATAAQPARPAAGAPGGAYTDGNLRLGANERYRSAILEASQRTGMTPQTAAAIIDAEAAKDRDGTWRADSRAGTSSATGLTQFLSGTWLEQARRPGSILNAEAKALGLVDQRNRVVDEGRLLALRTDPRLSILAGADYARQNLAGMRAVGVVPADAGPAAIAKLAYLAHHEGQGGAIGFLRGDMSYLGYGTYAANVPQSQRGRYMAENGGDYRQAYRAWLSDYADRNIDVRRFMVDGSDVDVPGVRNLYR
ncbi:MAG TPA: LysM peptidoglycan-binding domain-containing protein [Sphingomonas sp.]|jgi:LysM repeat protein